MEQEVLNLANKQIQLVISNALNSISQISLSRFPNRSLRCRSSSHNRNNRKGPFHNTIPRYSIPTTKNDFFHYQLRLLSNQTCYQKPFGRNKIFDIQYSFRLHEPHLTKINQQRYYLNSIENFVDEFIKHSIEFALLQISNEYLTSDNNLSDEDELSSTPNQRLRAINSYVDQFIHSTIEQAIENISSSEIELFTNRLTEDIINDALSIIADNEIYSRSILIDDEKYLKNIKKKSIQFENTEQEQINLFNQNLYHSSSINNNSNVESIDTLVINIAQQIYTNSLNELRQIFTNENNNS